MKKYVMAPYDFHKWRFFMGWTQSQAANKMGVSVTTIHRRETGKSKITEETRILCNYMSHVHMGTDL